MCGQGRAGRYGACRLPRVVCAQEEARKIVEQGICTGRSGYHHDGGFNWPPDNRDEHEQPATGSRKVVI